MNTATAQNFATQIAGKIAASPVGGTHWFDTPAQNCFIVGGVVPSVKLAQGASAGVPAIYSGIMSLLHELSDVEAQGIGWWLSDGVLYLDAVGTTLTDSDDDRENALLCAREIGEKAIGHWQNGAYAGDIMA
ncbi:MAG: hypothetical protein WCZ86_06230 [Desulfurivibrionaceae bacterium]